MSLQLCWFRSDLRVQDNTALVRAMAAGPTVGIYIATPEQWRQHDDALIKLDFWRRNLQLLQEELAVLNVPLLFCQVPLYRDVCPLLERIISAAGISDLHLNCEYPLNERRRDKEVLLLAERLGIGFHAWHDQLLLPPQAVLNGSGEPYKVFTPWARAARARLALSGLAESASPQRQAVLLLPDSLPVPCRLDELAWPRAGREFAEKWPAGAAEAAKRLQSFARTRVHDYKKLRDFPVVAGTSSLSPYLSAGVISIRDCWRINEYCENSDGVFAWQNELLWRDFYKSIMYHFPHICKRQPWNLAYRDFPWRHDEEQFERWCAGATGYPLVDAAMRQLQAEGWMHNRLRMVTAMFLSKNLLLDWRLGEQWFMQHLIDGDYAANNGGWQWSASTGTDAVPYFRVFNPLRQSQRFDPDAEFIRRYVPELAGCPAPAIHEPSRLRIAGYPAMLVDAAASRQRALESFKAFRPSF